MCWTRWLAAVGVIGVVCCCPAVGADDGKAFLKGDEILAQWEASYGRIEPLRVAYSCVLTNPDAHRKPVKVGKEMRVLKSVQYQHVQRLQYGDRYHIKYSMAEDGFAKSENVMEHAFDGKLTREYWGDNHSGQIAEGFVFRDTETMNKVDECLLRHRMRVSKDGPRYLPWLEHITTVRDPEVSVANNLEVIAGQPCHRLEIEAAGTMMTYTVWLAHQRSMMPMKYQRSFGHEVIVDIEVKEMASVQVDGGELWYPTKAVIINVFKGNRSDYLLTVDQFAPNVAVTESNFTFDFPTGTKVADHTKTAK